MHNLLYKTYNFLKGKEAQRSGRKSDECPSRPCKLYSLFQEQAWRQWWGYLVNRRAVRSPLSDPGIVPSDPTLESRAMENLSWLDE